MRSTIFRLALLGTLGLVFLACEPEPAFVVTVCGTKPLHGAMVALDGVEVGEMDYLMVHGTWFEAAMKKLYPDSPMDDIVALNIPIGPQGLSAGRHQVTVTKPGFVSESQAFEFPDPNGQEQVTLSFFPRLFSAVQPSTH